MVFSKIAVVLNTLSEVEGLDDVQEIVDRVCRCVVEVTPFQSALLNIYFDDDVYIGLVGGDEEMRQRFLDVSRKASPATRFRKREKMWRAHRIEGTNIIWIPEGSEVPFGPAYVPSEEIEGAEWRPDDRLMFFVRGSSGEVHGVLSLDRPADGKRPDPKKLGILEHVDRLMGHMGTVIQNKYLAGKLRESEELYGAVVEQGHDGILIVRDKTILFANRRIGEMLEREPQGLVGEPISSIVRKDSRGSLPGESTGVLANGVEVSLRRSEIRYGGATATLVAAADISERQRILRQLMRAQKLESVGTLASGIAHDFNNLLSGIVGYASLLKGHVDEPARRYVEAIVHATERAADVTRQLMGIVRDQDVSVAPFDVAALLTELRSLLTETFDPSIRVEVLCRPDLPRVLGDETQIHQTLLNICLNARDAMPKGGTLLLEAQPAPGQGVRILVRDTGRGMDSATLSKVFDPFFTTKDAGQGSGLGLYMAYRIVERHGGSMDIASRPDQGTTVEIVLPGRAAADAEEAAEPGAASRAAGGTVLLVDDEELVLEVGGEMLERLGYRVVTAADGRAAIRAIQNAPADLCCVIMDVAMPHMNGWEASRFIRVLRPDLPLFISSGHEVHERSGEAHGVQMAGVLKKPYGLDELRALLERAAALTASAAP